MKELLAQVSIGDELWLQDKAGTGINQTTRYIWIGSFLKPILGNIFIVAGVILFIFIVIGGIGIIKGASSGSDEDIKKGGKTISSAIFGFLIIFASYWIIRLIETITGIKIFESGL